MRNVLCVVCALFFTTSLFSQKKVLVNLNYCCDGKSLKANEFCYHNPLGTIYQINDLQFFLSNVAICVNGKWMAQSIQTKEYNGVKRQYTEPYYFDIADSLQQNSIAFTIKERKYTIDSIRFTFGFPKELNIPYSLTDSQLARMYWPEALGGGYHYMKLNVKFIDSLDRVSLFNCHLGRGVLGDDCFVDNDFTLTLPVGERTNVTYNNSKATFIELQMNIEKWFSDPNAIDFNLYTKGIMGNQDVMRKILENGRHVFIVSALVLKK